MTKGNPRKPDSLRQDRRPSRAKVVELVPQEPSEAPEPPKGLLKATRGAWETFWAGSLAKALVAEDLPKVRRLFKLYDIHDRAWAIFEETPTVLGSTKQIRTHPMADLAIRLAGEIRALEGDLGIGPAARLRLGIAVGQLALTVDQVQERVRRRMQEGGPDGPS